ncbi:STAS-like domain-containing protein [Paraburkholderia rhizosphaerae]|uniref:ArsR family transcriptional regulator n=1 Tax=Paraburkholderia rhizosphaerae TaxID=480658 RepID=A0A4R8LLK0_9BURK|nr:DUF4325 domain-containing protein [Paraburkholderia rhizosphaerae]TDY45424.1 ArsR family transcriptional regulator [Paraburkholderia rhizosphaerae]
MSSRVRTEGEQVRTFLLEHIESHVDVVSLTADRFSISRQAVNKHLLLLREQGAIVKEGSTRDARYRLVPLFTETFRFPLTQPLEEDVVWNEVVKPLIEPLPANVMNIWHHGFTEIFNNAIDHSSGTAILVKVTQTAVSTEMMISDDGVGIFTKIQTHLNLLDERHAIFELAKGKLTTDPRNHSGEGIFFTSRMFDQFGILSGALYFDHHKESYEDIVMERERAAPGTSVFLTLSNRATHTAREIFDEYTESDDYTFDKTVVPVDLAKYGTDDLVSRSQAKRLLARLDQFRRVVLDFRNVDTIGQAFADQIFRVFVDEHPQTQLLPVNANPAVQQMISRARAQREAAR